MKKLTIIVTTIVITLAILAFAGLAGAGPLAQSGLQGGAPTVISYQGRVALDGSPYDGTGYFKFAIVNADGETHWSHDGTSDGGSAPDSSVPLDVGQGLFNVLLGDPIYENMTEPMVADVFEAETETYLRVWFSTSEEPDSFLLLSPDRRVAAVPYSLQAQEAANADSVDGEHASAFADATHNHAPGDITPQGTGSGLDADTVDGQHASELGTHYQNVVIVAQSGGDYTSVQAAIDSITDASASNPYLVWVAPGVYNEQVTMKPHVHLQGAGQEATVITSAASSSVWPPGQATLLLASDTSLRDLTVGNSGVGGYNVALLATAGTARALATGVTARAQGAGGVRNYGICLLGSNTVVTLQQVTALGENGSSYNFGLRNGAAAALRGGAFTGQGGVYAHGIYNDATDVLLEVESVTALGENGSATNYGLYNYFGAAATLRGGTFTGRGGGSAYGIYHYYMLLEAEGVTALGENASGFNYGLRNTGGTAILRGGAFTGRGGGTVYGIYNNGIDSLLEAESVTALGENSSGENYGLYNYINGTAILRGGAFTGRGGTYACGIYNYGGGTLLEAGGVTALGEDGNDSYGLDNAWSAAATLRGGSFTGQGGTNACGISNSGSGAALEAVGVTTLAENGGLTNYALYNYDGAAAELRGGLFEARWGTYSRGINNTGTGTTLEAESGVALGENGSSSNFGLAISSGAAATLRGGSFTGSGVIDSSSSGLGISGSGTVTADSAQVTGSSSAVYQYGGTVRLGVSQLDGGIEHYGGIFECFQVYDETYTALTCP